MALGAARHRYHRCRRFAFCFCAGALGILLPIVLTAAYAFLSIRFEDVSICDFILYAITYFIGRQQFYEWSINILTLSDSSVGARIYALMTVLKGIAEIEMLCLNSRENFEYSKAYLKRRIDAEQNPTIRKLLQLDTTNLDQMQVQMATSREFLIIIRLRDEKESDVKSYLSRIEKSLKDQGFTERRAESEDSKRLRGVYYEQNVTTEKYEDFDGERWVILGD